MEKESGEHRELNIKSGTKKMSSVNWKFKLQRPV